MKTGESTAGATTTGKAAGCLAYALGLLGFWGLGACGALGAAFAECPPTTTLLLFGVWGIGGAGVGASIGGALAFVCGSQLGRGFSVVFGVGLGWLMAAPASVDRLTCTNTAQWGWLTLGAILIGLAVGSVGARRLRPFDSRARRAARIGLGLGAAFAYPLMMVLMPSSGSGMAEVWTVGAVIAAPFGAVLGAVCGTLGRSGRRAARPRWIRPPAGRDDLSA